MRHRVLMDRYEALDHIVEAAVELPGVRWMDDSGVLNMADDTGFTLHYVRVRNQLRGDDFGQLERQRLSIWLQHAYDELSRAQA